MKTKTATLVASIIACATGFTAQEDCAEKAKASEKPMAFQETGRTNGLFFLGPADQTLSYGASNAWLKTADTPEKGDSSKNVDYPLIVLRDDAETSAAADHSVPNKPVQTMDSDPSVFGSFTGNNTLDWMLRPESMKKGKKTTGSVQNVVFKSEDRLNGKIKIPEYEDLSLPQPVWYEWFSPRLFLAKWTDYWLNGCDAAPVVFVSFAF